MIKSAIIKKMTLELGADVVGIARPAPVTSKKEFLNWLGKGYAGDMDYLHKYQDERFDPAVLFPGATSIIAIGLNYYPREADAEKSKEPFRVARYAWGTDYHTVIRNILRRLRTALKEINDSIDARICVDTAPFMDKHWAQQAGLGWIGKHSNIVSLKYGSWLLLGSLIINDKVDSYDKPHKNHCGNCTACLKSCPTKAFPYKYIIDATKCISYWTIESKAAEIPPEIGNRMNSYVFGCDICLSACPFNRFQKPHHTELFRRRDNIDPIETGKVVEFSDDNFKDEYKTSPIYRPSLTGIKRNIAAASKK